MQQPKATYFTIHLFAILHVLATIMFRTWFGRDEFALTILTVAMVIYIARQWQRPLSIAISFALISCYAGYYIGDLGAGALLPQLGIIRNVVTTFGVTELIGWITYLIVKQHNGKEIELSWSKIKLNQLYLPHIFFLTAIIFIFRYFLSDILYRMKEMMNFMEFLTITISNVPLTISILWANITAARIFSKIQWFEKHTLIRLSAEYTYLISISLIGATIIYSTTNGFDISSLSNDNFLIHFFSILTISTIVYYTSNIVIYFRTKQKDELRKQIDIRKKANYQYGRLKQQLNPHFLFNSLNVLDHLVLTDPKRASAFIHKLAGVYRYQLSQEQKKTVSLDQEISFLEAYYNLLQERFGEALILSININQSARDIYQIVPCALQLLAENAVKHNMLSIEKPLLLKLTINNDTLIVSNNLQPKITQHSWGIGLQSINEQYNSLGYNSIDISKTNKEFTVTLPLIKH